MNIAIVRLYAATTHWMPDSPASKSRWMSGIATFTIIASRKIMNSPRPVATSVHIPPWASFDVRTDRAYARMKRGGNAEGRG